MMPFAVGVDLGKLHDPTAIAVVESTPARSAERPPRHAVRYLERLAINTSYVQIVGHVKALVAREPLVGVCEVVLDVGGVGEAVYDLFRASGIRARVIPVALTGVGRAHEEDGRWYVPKADLVAALDVRLPTAPKEFVIADGLPLADTLHAELAGFRANLSDAGRLTFEHDEGGGHGDLAVAVLLALWWQTRPRPVPGAFWAG